MMHANVIGAGLAGCEAAAQLSRRGISVTLYEQKPGHYSPAHKIPDFAELVCSNSLKSAAPDTAAGLLKTEMELLDSITIPAARANAVAAGGALAVERYGFSRMVTERIMSDRNITVVRGEYREIDLTVPTVIATGPLTEGSLADAISSVCGEYLSFYDAAAPIVAGDSLDMSKIHAASRYGKGDADYLNCYFGKEGYIAFRNELVSARLAKLSEMDYNVYEGCMPIEKLAARGEDSIRFGPMKPVGLTDPATGRRPYAAVQLRREDQAGSMYNLVGFQTNLAFPEQKRVFSMIPGLENAEFVRYGVMHRNSFINSPRLLNPDLSLKGEPNLCFAGQITGFEGYMESAACGIIAGRALAARLLGASPLVLPGETMCGSLIRYITEPNTNFQPMGANMGILPPLDYRERDKRVKYGKLASRAVEKLKECLNNENNY